jgi:hypothetical protein
MAEQSGIPKPGELFIGVIDFFAILVPGVLAVIFFGGQTIPKIPDSLLLMELFVAGFIVGHVLHGVGSFLDVLLYDPLFKPLDATANKGRHSISELKYFRRNDELYGLAKRFASFGNTIDQICGDNSPADPKDCDGEIKTPPGGMYQWARAWLRLHSPEATAELDRLEADSKLFRSLSVLAMALIAAWNALPHWKGELPLAVAVSVFSLWRYCDLRQKMVRSCYLHYVQLRSEAVQAETRRQDK